MVRLRRSMMYIPGSSQKMLDKARELQADSLIIDLEDAVAPGQKEAARDLVFKTIRTVDFGSRELTVRINALSTPYGLKDLEVIAQGKPDAIIVPKVNRPEDVYEVAEILDRIERAEGFQEGSIRLHLMIETPDGIVHIDTIAGCNPRIGALIFGAADYTKETRGKITPDRIELLYPLTRILLAARVAERDAIDSPFFDIKDMDGLIRHTEMAANLGYDGKSLIHPSQIEPVNRIFTPSEAEVEFAKRVVEAYEQGEKEGRGAIALDGKLIEHLHAEAARRTLLIAKQAGMIQ